MATTEREYPVRGPNQLVLLGLVAASLALSIGSYLVPNAWKRPLWRNVRVECVEYTRYADGTESATPIGIEACGLVPAAETP